jgi:hypothetical protein
MDCKNCECQRGLGLLVLEALVGAIVGIRSSVKHHRHRSRGDGCCDVKAGCDRGHRHQDGPCQAHGNGHGPVSGRI